MATEKKEKRFGGESVFNIFTGTLTRKLGSGFGAILVILIALVVYTESKLSEVSELSERVSNLRLPTLDASKSMLSGVNRSLAGLRGYMLLGKDIFKAERKAAWDEDMLPALAFLTAISKNWTNPDNIAKLEQIKTELVEFQKAQDDIENISQTLDNNLSLKILIEEAAPEAAILSKKITEIIDEELTLPATPERKALLGMMADVRGTLGLALANIRAFILTGDVQFQDKFNALWAKNSRRFQNLTDNRPLLTQTQKSNFDVFTSSRKVFSPLPGQMFEMRGREDWNIANYWLGVKAAPRAKIIAENLRSMVANQKVLAETDAKEAATLLTSLVRAISILAVLAVFLGALLAYFTAKSITKPIQSAVEFSESIADGDLSVPDLEVTSQDEIGTLVVALNTMKSKLVDLITQFRANAEQVSSAATEIASAAEQSASGAGEQESQAGEVSSSIEQMAATIVESSQNAASATESARNAAEAAGEGGHIVQQTIEGMQAIADSVRESAETITELGKRSDEIGEIIGVIDDIADQTNLLALNAAIEAARAGEQGRGFAVVADEVRKLAERTTKATAEIAGMIKGIQKDTSGAVTSMEEGTKQVEAGMELAVKAGDSLTSIVSVVSEVQKMIEQIATASDEQSAAAEQISGNVGNIASVSKQSAQSAEQMAATAEELNRQTDALNELVSRFKLEDTESSSFQHDAVTDSKEG